MHFPMGSDALKLETLIGFKFAMAEPELPAEEVERRRDAALLRALSTPHKRQAETKVELR